MEERKDKQDAQRILLIKETLASAEKNIQAAKSLLAQIETKFTPQKKTYGVADEGKVVEGTFDGQVMIGADGRQYPVPANYASKSKLVEGDMLKLVIGEDGNFIYKQIGPVQRKRLIGLLEENVKEGGYDLTSEGKKYKVLLAAVTYHRANAGDEVAFVVADSEDAKWGAIENILKKGGEINLDASKNLSEEPQEPAPETPAPEEPKEKKPKGKKVLNLEEVKTPKKDAKKDAKKIDKEWSPNLEEIEKEIKGQTKKSK